MLRLSPFLFSVGKINLLRCNNTGKKKEKPEKEHGKAALSRS